MIRSYAWGKSLSKYGYKDGTVSLRARSIFNLRVVKVSYAALILHAFRLQLEADFRPMSRLPRPTQSKYLEDVILCARRVAPLPFNRPLMPRRTHAFCRKRLAAAASRLRLRRKPIVAPVSQPLDTDTLVCRRLGHTSHQQRQDRCVHFGSCSRSLSDGGNCAATQPSKRVSRKPRRLLISSS